jgi:4-hydroxy-2-oxoglutarate aldolase
MKLSGIFAAIPTPFDHNGDVYRTKIEHNLTRWNETSLAGYVVGSSAGEGVLLAQDEKIAVWELSAKHAGEGRTLIADVSVEGVHEATVLSKHAARLGYHAVCARVPVHYSGLMYGAESQALFFRALADRSPVPVIIVDEQSWMGDDLAVSTIAKLSQHPNIAGVVESGNPVMGLKAILGSVRPGFQVLVGSAPDLWNALKDGAHGAVLPFAAAAPYGAIAVWEAFRTREEEAGQDWQDRISHPSVLVTDVYGVAGLKHAMDLNGYYGGPPRLPLTPLSVDAKSEIAKSFASFSGKT